MAIGGQKKPSGDGMPCISPYRAGKKPPVVTGGYLFRSPQFRRTIIIPKPHHSQHSYKL